MAYDPTDEIFAELERRHGGRDEPVYSDPDPGLGAAAPEAVAETVRAAEERAIEQDRFKSDVLRHGYGSAVRRQWVRRQFGG